MHEAHSLLQPQMDFQSMAWHIIGDEARHLVKLGDLDGLEKLALAAGDKSAVEIQFQMIFHALEKRTQISREIVLEWVRRYIAWGWSTSPDENPICILDIQARQMFDLAMSLNNADVARDIAWAMLCSYPSELIWWQKQHYHLSHPGPRMGH